MLSARACDAQHANDAARRAGMREMFERAHTVFPDQSCICCGGAKIGRRPRNVAGPAPISSTQYAKPTMLS
jgi:hypothetical protein